MDYFDGVYFDGTTTRPYPVRVYLSRENLLIEFKETEHSLHWNYQLIQRNEVNYDTAILKYGVFPFQTLEVKGKDFMKHATLVVPTADFIKSPYTRFLSGGVWALISGLVAVIGIGVLAYFFLVPFIIDTTVENVPVSYEKKLGASVKATILASEEVDHDKTLAMNGFFRNLKGRGTYEAEITVLNSRVKNAMAVPGGDIFVYSRIIDDMKSPGELAALLGHESGHLENRHSTKMLARNLSNYILVSILVGDVSGVLTVLVDNASMLNKLSYGRAAEDESDAHGLKLMAENGYPVQAMIDLFTNLKEDKTSEIAEHIPDFLLTHPNLDKRIEAVKLRAKEITVSTQPSDSLLYYWNKLKEQGSTLN